jgi:V/A-type H+-transporting ATPase subunit E
MSYRELIDALHRESEQKARKIWEEAEAEAERVRADASKRIGEAREGRERSQSSAVKVLTEAILSEAAARARATRLLAEKDLSDRLYRIALNSLHRLRGEGYNEIFSALVDELPQCEWAVVKVNPQDRVLAETFFPNNEVVSDPAITGGLDVTEKAGNVRIVNTLEKRLERIWPEILPAMTDKVRSEMEREGQS